MDLHLDRHLIPDFNMKALLSDKILTYQQQATINYLQPRDGSNIPCFISTKLF